MSQITKKLIVCGDSFSIGLGCIDLKTEPYGSLLAHNLDRKLVNLAKGSSTNLSIYLQAQYAADNIASVDDIVLISSTSYERVDWFPWDDDSEPHTELYNYDVNYHQYPPYGKITSDRIFLEKHPMEDDSRYNGRMFTENFITVVEFWETFRKDDKESGYYSRFANEPKERMKTLYDFATTIHDNRINRLHSIGVLTMAHQMLKKKNIKHLILTYEIDQYAKFMEEENLVELSWGILSKDYPDKLNSLHTSPVGHEVAFKTVLAKIKQNGWL